MSLLNIARSITFFSLFIQLLGLTCAVKIDSYTSRKTRRTMFAIIVSLLRTTLIGQKNYNIEI